MSSPRYVLALDQGTSGSTALVVDADGGVRARGYAELPQHYPQPGWVEHDAEDIWATAVAAAQHALHAAGLSGRDVAAIGITNQRETTLVWERAGGRPIARAIVWQCRRTAEACERLKRDGAEAVIRERTGLVADAYFSGTKLAWLLDNVPGARARATRGELAFGTVDSWLLWKLTGGRVHATDASNASRTMCLDIRSVTWDAELLRLLRVPAEVCPEIRPSSGVIAETCDLGWLPAGIPISGVAGDQQAALFGQACFEPGATKNTYGTGCFVLMNTGKDAVVSSQGLLTTIAWQLGGQTTYALEGSVFVAGAAVQWLRDGLGLLPTAADSQRLAESVPDSGGMYVVPAFVGLGSPYWDMYARGTIVGITRGTTAAHLTRAVLESIAYQSRDVIDVMSREARLALTSVKVDGGAAANDFLCQFQADVLDAEVVRPETIETTALGAAYLAGLGIGMWTSLDDLSRRARVDRVFTPAMPERRRAALYGGWKRAVDCARGWAARPGSEESVTTVYPITCDGRSTEELVEAGRYGYAHSNVNSENFPARRAGGSPRRRIVLLEFERDVTSEEVLTEAARRGLERPAYEDALHFGIEYPDVQRERPVVFLHHPWFGFFGRRDVLCLWSNAGRRELGLEGFDDLWNRRYRFAFVEPA